MRVCACMRVRVHACIFKVLVSLALSTGIDEQDYSKYPCEAVQKVFIRAYLEENSRLKGLCYSTILGFEVQWANVSR